MILAKNINYFHENKNKETTVGKKKKIGITNFAVIACRSILGISFTVALFRASFTATIYNNKKKTYVYK